MDDRLIYTPGERPSQKGAGAFREILIREVLTCRLSENEQPKLVLKEPGWLFVGEKKPPEGFNL